MVIAGRHKRQRGQYVLSLFKQIGRGRNATEMRQRGSFDVHIIGTASALGRIKWTTMHHVLQGLSGMIGPAAGSICSPSRERLWW